MKVLLVSHLFLPHIGGVENLVDIELKYLSQFGYEATLITSDGSGAGKIPEYDRVRIIRIPAWHGLEERLGIPYPLFSPQLVQTLIRQILAHDVVHCHGMMFMGTVAATLLCSFFGKPSVITDHGGIQQFQHPLATFAARLLAETAGRLSCLFANRLIAYNQRIQQTLNKLGARRDAEFLANPVDVNLFSPRTQQTRQAARATLGWHPQDRKILYVGRLIATKGLPLLLKAWPHRELIVCGPGDRTLLEEAPEVSYLPPRPQAELPTLYHAADLLVLPAQVREGFPLVVQEALCCGLPVILGYDPGFEPYRSIPGLRFCQQTPESIREAIQQALTDFPASAIPEQAEKTSFFPDPAEWIRRIYHPERSAGSKP